MGDIDFHCQHTLAGLCTCIAPVGTTSAVRLNGFPIFLQMSAECNNLVIVFHQEFGETLTIRFIRGAENNLRLRIGESITVGDFRVL
jgi:hypothetical protein